MIYLVSQNDYSGVEYTAPKEVLELLLSKGGKKNLPYSKPKWFKGEHSEYEKLSKENDFSKGFNVDFKNILVNEQEFSVIFSYCKVESLISQDVIKHEVNINLDELADKITSRVINNASHLFNSKLEVHQPNMPLFQYNQYTYVLDCCTEVLQEEYIDKGWRVVCVCPQPDQRRPDYILAKYIDSTK